MLKKSIITLSLLSILTGCTLSGNAKNDSQTIGGAQDKDELTTNSTLNISLIGRGVLNAQSPEGAAEIVAYQASKKLIYAINSSGTTAVVNVIPADTFDQSRLIKNNEGVVNTTNLAPTITLTLNDNTPGDANSIAIDENNQLLAVAMAAENTGETGFIAFYDISGETPVFIKNVTAGFLPDMVAFSYDGTKAIVANEGEPSGDYSVDPEGSISIIGITNNVISDKAVNIDFKAYNNKQAELEAQGVFFANPSGRTINGKRINTTVAMDLEPEYISISKDNKYAYVSIQENNALAIVNLQDNSLELKGLGFKDWSNLQLDASDKDGGINFKSYPGLYGIYQPDSISSFSWKGADFIVSANEGDAREYSFNTIDEADCIEKGGMDFDKDNGCLAYSDKSRVEDLTLAGNFSYLNNDDNDIGRLKVTTAKGDTNNDGQYESLYTYGARSFTIWDSNGLVVFDSGDDIARITASVHGESFNNQEDENKGDSRSDDKGAEPEALTIGKIGDRTFAFIGLERMGSIMVYDITNPYDVHFEDYFYNRGLIKAADITGDLAPEGMVFVSAEKSATGNALLIVGNELSGSIAVWEITAK